MPSYQICTAAASDLLPKVGIAFVSVKARIAAFTFHSILSGLSREITGLGEICRLAIVGLLIPLFASWPVMRGGCRRASAVAGGCRKSCSDRHIWAALEMSVDAGEGRCSLTADMCSLHSRKGMMTARATDSNFVWQRTAGIRNIANGNLTQQISWQKNKTKHSGSSVGQQLQARAAILWPQCLLRVKPQTT